MGEESPTELGFAGIGSRAEGRKAAGEPRWGLLGVLGERKAAVKKQFRADIPDCVLQASCPFQFPLESQVKNCLQLTDWVMGKHYKTSELTGKKGHLGSCFHILGLLHCLLPGLESHFLGENTYLDACSDQASPYHRAVMHERGLRCIF